ncbi:hypothetical protein DL771_011850 [Monosporascus sp. 5C6A]|nr:hypothetical protein DL771_011850 [Monosporascus sp. 5C6A]
MNLQGLTQTLVESFNALADEVQNLSDRQVILEHKLRFAHEQFQYLADKYAPAAPEISETLVKLQIPPELHSQTLANTNFVPLPRRNDPNSKHQIALIIREGRRVASSLTDFSKSSQSSRESHPPTTMTSLSTILEQDFTVEGKKGKLDCPFSEEPEAGNEDGERRHSNAPHDTSDPICAAMNDESGSQPAASGTAKCPIRYTDHHSPEEIAHYLETHKHELPRSHEVCVRRYQKNEDHIRKLDAKYGNLVSMVEGLTRIHQPMLPEQDTRPQTDVEKTSNQRVENWAQTVSATVADDPDRTALAPREDDEERQSRFDRPLKEVRVGESPSRPWGISVPVFDTPSGRGEPDERPLSPPPAPVPMPLSLLPNPETPAKGVGKCPFDHAKMRQMMDGATPIRQEDQSSVKLGDIPPTNNGNQPFAGAEQQQQQPPPLPGRASTPPQQPAFLNAADVAPPKPDGGTPQMLFTGPVFIGYPIEQAIQFMQHVQGSR